MKPREKVERIIEGMLFYVKMGKNMGYVPQEILESVMNKLEELFAPLTDEEIEKYIAEKKKAIKSFFELYARNDLSWREKLNYLDKYIKATEIFGEEAHSYFQEQVEIIKNEAPEEVIKGLFLFIKEFLIILYKILEFTPTCKCGNKTVYEYTTYQGDIPIKVEFLCEKCGKELVSSFKPKYAG
jgi:hypothetical protein